MVNGWIAATPTTTTTFTTATAITTAAATATTASVIIVSFITGASAGIVVSVSWVRRDVVDCGVRTVVTRVSGYFALSTAATNIAAVVVTATAC